VFYTYLREKRVIFSFYIYIYIGFLNEIDRVYCAVPSDTLNTGRVTSRLEISNVLLLSQRCHILLGLST